MPRSGHVIFPKTIRPKKVILNTKDTFAAAMIYVMLSRVCTLWQIFILNEFDEKKMYPNTKALEELERLNRISKNSNPSLWEMPNRDIIKISSLNCRSLNKHHEDIFSDDLILKSDIICLNETWQENDDIAENLEYSDYKVKANSRGRGKGITTYFNNTIFQHEFDVKEENMQLSKFKSPILDIIVLYRSHGGSFKDLNHFIEKMESEEKPTLVVGDFNFCFRDEPSNPTKMFLTRKNYQQLIHEPTHIEGHILDQAYIRDPSTVLQWTSELHSKYYTDHKCLAITIKKVRVNWILKKYFTFYYLGDN